MEHRARGQPVAVQGQVNCPEAPTASGHTPCTHPPTESARREGCGDDDDDGDEYDSNAPCGLAKMLTFCASRFKMPSGRWALMSDTYAKEFTSKHVTPLTLILRFGEASAEEGDYWVAEKALQAAVKGMTEMLGEDSESTIAATCCLAAFLMRRKQSSEEEEEADALFSKVQTWWEQQDEECTERVPIGDITVPLCQYLSQKGRHSEAIHVAQSVYETQLDFQGPDTLDTLTTACALLDALCAAGEWAEASQLVADTLAEYEVDSPSRAETVNAFVNSLCAHGSKLQWKQALTLCRAEAKRQQQLPASSDTLEDGIKMLLAELQVHLTLKQLSEACKVWDQVLALLPPVSERGDNEQGGLALLTRLTTALVDAGKHTRAEPLLRHQLDWHTHRLKQGYAPHQLLLTAQLLGTALNNMGKPAEEGDLWSAVCMSFYGRPVVYFQHSVNAGCYLITTQAQPGTEPRLRNVAMLCIVHLHCIERILDQTGVEHDERHQGVPGGIYDLRCRLDGQLILSSMHTLTRLDMRNQAIELGLGAVMVILRQAPVTGDWEGLYSIQKELATTMHGSSFLKEALVMLTDCLEVWEGRDGPAGTRTLHTSTSLGRYFVEVGDKSAAVRHFRAAYEGWQQTGEEFEGEAFSSADVLAMCLCHMGQPEEAEVIWRQVQAQMQVKGNPDRKAALAIKVQLAWCMTLQEGADVGVAEESLYARFMQPSPLESKRSGHAHQKGGSKGPATGVTAAGSSSSSRGTMNTANTAKTANAGNAVDAAAADAARAAAAEAAATALLAEEEAEAERAKKAAEAKKSKKKAGKERKRQAAAAAVEASEVGASCSEQLDSSALLSPQGTLPLQQHHGQNQAGQDCQVQPEVTSSSVEDKQGVGAHRDITNASHSKAASSTNSAASAAAGSSSADADRVAAAEAAAAALLAEEEAEAERAALKVEKAGEKKRKKKEKEKKKQAAAAGGATSQQDTSTDVPAGVCAATAAEVVMTAAEAAGAAAAATVATGADEQTANTLDFAGTMPLPPISLAPPTTTAQTEPMLQPSAVQCSALQANQGDESSDQRQATPHTWPTSSQSALPPHLQHLPPNHPLRLQFGGMGLGVGGWQAASTLPSSQAAPRQVPLVVAAMQALGRTATVATVATSTAALAPAPAAAASAVVAAAPLQAAQSAPARVKVECCVCLSMRMPVTFQPCGHAICCKGCARQVVASTRPVCPFCDVHIQGVMSL